MPTAADRASVDGDRSPRGRGRDRRAATPPSNVTSTCSAPATASTSPFDVEEVDGAVRGAPVRAAAVAGQRHGDAPGFARARHARAELEEPHVGALAVPVVRDRREQPGQQRRAKHRELRRQRIADRHDRPLVGEMAPPAAASMNENVSASEQPAASSTLRTSRSRSMRGSDGAGGRARAAGKVDGNRS